MKGFGVAEWTLNKKEVVFLSEFALMGDRISRLVNTDIDPWRL